MKEVDNKLTIAKVIHMDTQRKILTLIKEKGSLSGTRLSAMLGISRQAVNKQLKKLVQAGVVVKQGVTRGAVYKSADSQGNIPEKFRKTYSLNKIEEDKVFGDVARFLHLQRELSPNAAEIARYSFTEILNNAIDHSQSEKCLVEVQCDDFTFRFRIRDYGIGLFFSIYNKFSLQDENAAVGELIKGKTTTMAEKHSGEGIFFTSKAADHISFRSHRTKLVFDNKRQDAFIEELRTIQGTEVVFSISKRTRRQLDKIFSHFAPAEFDYKFEKTQAMIKLLLADCISRSEAKRLLTGVDKFRMVVFDFSGVKRVGQGFADEIFRVFLQNQPEISMQIINLKPSLRPIIEHVVDNKIIKRLTIS